MGSIGEALGNVVGIVENTIYRIVDFNSGKFFDVPATDKYFGDWAAAFEAYKNYAQEHFTAMDNIASTNSWMGEDADAVKTMLSDTETTLLEDIIKLHDDINELHATILENFKLTVDSAPDAYISYDDLMQIEKDFKKKADNFKDKATLAERTILDMQAKYSKYGPISTPDFSPGKTAFANLCGDEETDGFLAECRTKLVNFDNETQILITEKDIVNRVNQLESRMCQFVIETYPEYKLDAFVTDIDKLEQAFKGAKAERILKKDASLWTINDALLVTSWYKAAVEQGDLKTIESIYETLLVNQCKGVNIKDDGEEKVCNGDNYDIYLSYMNPDKAYIMLFFLSAMGCSDGEGYQTLYTMSQENLICAVKTGTTPPSFGISTEELGYGILVKWTASHASGIQSYNENVIFNKQGLSLQEKYDLVKEDENVSKQYRGQLKSAKDIIRKEELEQNFYNADFKTHAKYTKGEQAKNDSYAMYQYINDPEFRMQAEYSGGYEFLDYGLSLMSKKQVYIYNYLHYQDSINGTDTADEYIELITPKLREQAANKFYSGIKDSKATKAIVEACIGFDGVGNGVKNTFGLNDDRDGVAMLTTADYTDNLIMSNVESTGEAVLYTVAKAGGASVPGIIVAVGTEGLGTPGLIASVGGNAAIYGTSAGGNAKAQAERAGYTPSQARTYGLEVGAKEAVKTGALTGISLSAGAGSLNTNIPMPMGALGAGASGFAIEFVDEAAASPALRYYTLNDSKAYEDVLMKDVLINSSIAGAVTGASYGLKAGKKVENTENIYEGANKLNDEICNNGKILIEDTEFFKENGGMDASDYISVHSRKHIYSPDRVSTTKRTQYGRNVNIDKLCVDTIKYPDEVVYNTNQNVIIYKKEYPFNISTDATPTGKHRVFVPLNIQGKKTIRMSQFPLFER